eukprot:3911074-Rhodomonas_salina.3
MSWERQEGYQGAGDAMVEKAAQDLRTHGSCPNPAHRWDMKSGFMSIARGFEHWKRTILSALPLRTAWLLSSSFCLWCRGEDECQYFSTVVEGKLAVCPHAETRKSWDHRGHLTFASAPALHVPTALVSHGYPRSSR